MVDYLLGDSGKKQQPFYRKAVPIETKPAHRVSPDMAGIMLDQNGDPFDCMGRFTSDEIEKKFGGKQEAIRSLRKTQMFQPKPESYETLNLAKTQTQSFAAEYKDTKTSKMRTIIPM